AVVLFSISAWSADFQVKVLDPNSAAVPGAQVELFSGSSSRAIAVQMTSAQGLADFHDVASTEVRVHVLAAGFAEAWQTADSTAQTMTVTLRLAVATETVVVSATG